MKFFLVITLVFVVNFVYAAEIDVKLNEILYDVPMGIEGDANRDSIRDAYQDEFVEINNTGINPVDISNWIITDESGDEFLFPSGIIIAPGEFIVLFGGGLPTGFLGQVFVDDGRIGNGLSNSGEIVFLKNAIGQEIDSCNDNGATEDQSYYCWPEGTDNWFVETGETGFAIFTPGTTNQDRALPVVLSSFTATISSNDEVVLRWRTRSETNNLGFQVHKNNKKLGSLIKSQGDSGYYQIIDDDVKNGETYFYYIEDIDFFGNKNRSKILEVKVSRKLVANFVKPKFALYQNYPNPFNPETWIPFRLAKACDVILKIHDAKGNLIHEFLGNKTSGYHVIYWKSQVVSGVYFYTLQAENFKATKKMVILK